MEGGPADTASVGLVLEGIVLQWLNDSLAMCLGNSGSQMQAGDSSTGRGKEEKLFNARALT